MDLFKSGVKILGRKHFNLFTTEALGTRSQDVSVVDIYVTVNNLTSTHINSIW